jgi:hypothetical protein
LEQVEELKKLSKIDLLEFYEKYFLTDSKRLITQIFSFKFNNDFDKKFNNNEEFNYISNIYQFKSNSTLFPSFSKY